jgi:enhancing lycopene biosynthesis protein 2
MKTAVYTLGNNGHQPVSIEVQAGTTAAVGDVAQTVTGLLTIAPGKQVVIESARVNDGQIANLKKANFITAVQSYI